MSPRAPYVSTFLRGFIIVMLTAMNVIQMTGRHYGGALFCGAALSWVWWRNAHGAAHESAPFLRECYATGAGAGTIAGMALMHWWYG